jgi:hypothetical protein
MFFDFLLLLLALALVLAGAGLLFLLLPRHTAARTAGLFPGRKP